MADCKCHEKYSIVTSSLFIFDHCTDNWEGKKKERKKEGKEKRKKDRMKYEAIDRLFDVVHRIDHY